MSAQLDMEEAQPSNLQPVEVEEGTPTANVDTTIIIKYIPVVESVDPGDIEMKDGCNGNENQEAKLDLSNDQKKPRTRRGDILNWEKKFSIIAEVESAANKFGAKSAIAKKYGIARSTLSTLLSQKDKITSLVEQGKNFGFRDKLPKFPKVDIALYEWFKGMKSAEGNREPIVSGHALKEKAEQLAKTFGYENAQISKPWIARWKHRHGISVKRNRRSSGSGRHDLNGSSNDFDLSAFKDDEKPATHVNAKSMLSSANIFTLSEVGICWKLMPDQAIAFSSCKCALCKRLEPCIAALVGVNLTGQDILPLLTVGKTQSPKLSGDKVSSYETSTSGRITEEVFQSYLLTLNDAMVEQNRFISLHVDPHLEQWGQVNLSNVEICKFSSPQSTELLNTSQRAAKHLKGIYRQRLVRKLLWNEFNRCKFMCDLSEALTELQHAWLLVGETFKGIESLGNTDGNTKFNIDITLERFQSAHAWERTCSLFKLPSSIKFNDYINVDNDIFAVATNASDAIDTQLTQPSNQLLETSDTTHCESSDSISTVLKATNTLLDYVKNYQSLPHNSIALDVIKGLDRLVDTLMMDNQQGLPSVPLSSFDSYTNCKHDNTP